MLRLVVSWLMLLSVHAVAVAKDVVGVVIFSGKSRYVINTDSGMTVCEWYGGHELEEGDAVIGQLHQFGFHTVVLVKNGRGVKT